MYNIHYDVLNTKNYGLPQNRERIFIIGIKKSIQKKDYTTPPHKKMKPLKDCLIEHKIHNDTIISNSLQKNLNNVKNPNSIITPFGFASIVQNMSPTLTTNCSQFFYVKYNRYLFPKECLLLQCFPKNFKQVVTNTSMFKQAGNSMSVCVLKAIFAQLKL